ncbi:MAG: glycosyl hydrolase [Ktedonobacteraceae bacterium]|nr:glycosyl hydrolase [Ktedonobacteraceae bacterium]
MIKLYAALETALAVIRQQQREWHVDLHLIGSQPHGVVVDPIRPQRVYCGTFDQGLWLSDDAGASWQHVAAGISSEHVTSVAVSPLERVNGASVVYAGTEPSALFRSENGGSTWQDLAALRQLPSASTWSFPPRPSTHHVRWITPDPVVAGRIFAAIEAGALIRSHDGGQTWEDRQPDGPLDTHTLLMHPQVPNHLYSAAGDGFLQAGAGFAESHDGGNTWFRPGEGLHHHYLWGAAADIADPSTLVISAASSPMTAHHDAQAESVLYRRSGNGSWKRVEAGLPPARGMLASVLATHQDEPGVFILCCEQPGHLSLQRRGRQLGAVTYSLACQCANGPYHGARPGTGVIAVERWAVTHG